MKININTGMALYAGLLGLAVYGAYKLFKADEKRAEEFKEYKKNKLEDVDLGIKEATIENEDLDEEHRVYAMGVLSNLHTKVVTASNQETFDRTLKDFIDMRNYLMSDKPKFAKQSYISAIKARDDERKARNAELAERRRERENRDAFVSALKALKSEVNVVVGDPEKRREVSNDILTKVLTS